MNISAISSVQGGQKAYNAPRKDSYKLKTFMQWTDKPYIVDFFGQS